MLRPKGFFLERYIINDGETIEITKSCPYIIHECCECGIRHKWEFIWKRQGLEIKITEEPLTSRQRRVADAQADDKPSKID